MLNFFSINRLWAVFLKEFIQMRRDKFTFAMIIGIPVFQLIIFGFAINSDPKHLNTAILSQDNSVFTRSIVSALKNTAYFNINKITTSEAEANELLNRGQVQFVINIPYDFSHNLVKNKNPTILVEADASDPSAITGAFAVLDKISKSALNYDLKPIAKPALPDFEFKTHLRYNPESKTTYSIIPGLIGTILTFTMIFMTALSITRERERGTMENLLATPVRPFEVMLGKIIPNIALGYVQVIVILLLAWFIFKVPIQGSFSLLSIATIFFIFANLMVGLTFSTIAKNQLQAVQMSVFFFLPSMLLSGFMFPFYGMPSWAQNIGNCLPLTHFLRIIRGIFLKNNGWQDILPHLYPIMVFIFIITTITLIRYKKNLD